MTFTKDQLVNLLREKTCSIRYRKVGGDDATMTCTLQESILPPRTSSGGSAKAPNDEVVIAYNTEKSAFRSFRVENVISVDVIG